MGYTTAEDLVLSMTNGRIDYWYGKNFQPMPGWWIIFEQFGETRTHPLPLTWLLT
jgi:hypothetical protein